MGASAIFDGDPLLDIAPWIGEMRASFRWSLVTKGTFSVIGELHPMRDVTPRMDNQPTRKIKRQVGNVVLPPDEAADINLFSDRVYPEMVLEDGRSSPLGVFMFLAPKEQRSSRPIPLATKLVDQGFQLDQKTRTTFSVPSGGSVRDALVNAVGEAGFVDEELRISESTTKTLDPISWPAGTSRARIVDELAQLMGFYSPHFNNEGQLVARPVDDLAFAPTVEYLPVDSRVYADTINETSTLLEAPNVYLVLNNGSVPDEVAGEYRVPDEAPHSVKSRGFEVAEVTKMQGIEDTDQALEIAKSKAFQAPGDFRRVELTSPPDPRHDTNDLILWDGELWREVRWSMQMRSGGEMRHEMRKLY